MVRFAASLRTRLIIFAAVMVIPVFGILAYDAYDQRHTATVAAQTKLRNMARLAALEQASAVAVTRELLAALAKLPEVRLPSRRAACHTVLSGLLKQLPRYANLGVIALDGSVRCSGLPLPKDVRLTDRSYFQAALADGDFSVGDYQVGRITHKASVNFGYPVVDEQGRIDAVVFAALDLAWFDDLFATMSWPDGTIVALLDRHGNVLSRLPSAPGSIGHSDPHFRFFYTSSAAPVDELVDGLDADGVQWLRARIPLAEQRADGLYLGIAIPEGSLFAGVHQRLARDVALLTAVLLVVLAVTWWGSELLVLMPINALASAARRLGKGSLGARTGLQHGPSQLGQLARNFDDMAEGIERRELELQRINRVLRTLSTGNQTLLRARDEASLLQAMCRVPVEAGGFRSAGVGYLVQDASKTIQPMAYFGEQESVFANLPFTWADTPEGRGPSGQAAITGEPQVANDLQGDAQYAAWHEVASRLGVKSAVSLPLRVEGEVIGVFSVYANEVDAFGPSEVQLLMEMAEDLAFGIETLRLRARHDEADAALKQAVYQDQLTGLPNRLALLERLQRAVDEARQQRTSLALLVLDLNRFGEITDTLGYDPADAVLRSVGIRLQSTLGDKAFVARLADDEFAVILHGADAEHARQSARAVEQVLETPFELGGLILSMHATIGIALFPGHSAEAERLLRYATKAVIQARRAADDCLVYVPESEQASRRRLMLGHRLQRSIDENELLLFCQPKVSLVNDCVCGAEALVRWRHPEFGMIPPAEFVTLAEHTGFIKPLTDWVLRTAVQENHAWSHEGDVNLPIAVNLSVHNLRDAELVGRVRDLIETWGLPPDRLHLELTESALMQDPAGALKVLTALHDMGLQLFIDDFGTGYSSLGYLQRLPVDAIKIDKSFVEDLPTSVDAASIVRSTIELAHNLGKIVVAEGVEDGDTLEQLRALGCDVVQGYYISKPMPVEAFPDWLRESPWALGQCSTQPPPSGP